MDDTISRQAAIDALAEWHDVAITNRLNNLPPAQPSVSKTETVEDCISRQAAIDAIEHRLAEPAYQHEGEDWYTGMNCAESELYDLPPAQPEPIKINIDDFNKEDLERFKKELRNTPITVLPAQPEIIRCKDCKLQKGEPMSDLISRQAAIDALDVLCQEYRYRIPGKRETYSQYNEAWQDALDRAEGAIFNLPSAVLNLMIFAV